MKKYNPLSICPKCNSPLGADTEWKVFSEDDGMVVEFMIRTCKNCGYQWDETPLDVAGIESDVEECEPCDDETHSEMLDVLKQAREYVKMVSKETLGRGIKYDFSDYNLLDEIKSVIEKAERGNQ